MNIKFGPAGLGPVKEAVENLKAFDKLGLKACEIAFTYGIYIKKNEAEEIGKEVKKLGIELSIHAPYWINLNSKEKVKIEASKKRIMDCCEIGHYLNAKRVIFHCGFYSGMKPEEAFENIKLQIVELLEEVKKRKLNIELCPEIIGKKNVFGSIEEISELVRQTGCGFCIDFAHVLARYGKYEFDLIAKSFPQKKWHCHFSGIEYGEKGERNHIPTPSAEFNKIFTGIPKDREIILINESPSPVEDSIEGLKISKKF